MKEFLVWLLGIVIFCAVMYGMYWVFKTVSYQIFYDTMVQETIREMVKPEYLK